MNKDIEVQVLMFIEKKVGIKPTLNTLIFDDLGIDGIDAETFIDEFAKHFNVNMKGFNIYEFFTPEKELLNVFKAIYKRLFTKVKPKVNFPVSHLIEVVERKEWFPFVQ